MRSEAVNINCCCRILTILLRRTNFLKIDFNLNRLRLRLRHQLLGWHQAATSRRSATIPDWITATIPIRNLSVRSGGSVLGSLGMKLRQHKRKNTIIVTRSLSSVTSKRVLLVELAELSHHYLRRNAILWIFPTIISHIIFSCFSLMLPLLLLLLFSFFGFKNEFFPEASYFVELSVCSSGGTNSSL